MKTADSSVNTIWWALKIALGVMPTVAGLDKYFNKPTDWSMYLSPLATRLTHLSAPAWMHSVGVMEMIAGLIVLSRRARIGGFVVMLWLIAISVNLLATGMFYDLALRDVELAVSAFVLAELCAAREQNALAA